MSEEQNQFELLKSFHEQFAQNQNHHQNLFIRFLSAVFIVIVAYFIVFVNTQSTAKWHDLIFMTNTNKIISYALWHLIGAYFIAHIIFIVMALMVVNMGYNFRRDQKVNTEIRKKYLDDNTYDQVFGDRAFNVDNLKFDDYLPGFHFIFYCSLLVLQCILFISLLVKSQSILTLCSCLSSLLYMLPIFFSIIIYPYYYRKFKRKVVGN